VTTSATDPTTSGVAEVVADDPATAVAGTGRDRRRAGARFSAAVLVPPLIVFAVLIGIWYLVSNSLDQDAKFLVPPPHQVLQLGFGDPDHLTELLRGLGLTAEVALIGLAFAIVVGTLWAVAMNQASWVERSLYPYAVMLQCTPILAIVPLIRFWFDSGQGARVLVCVLISLFPIISNTLFGLQSVDRGHHDLFTLHGAGRWTRLRKLQFPAALPAIFVGLRTAAGLSVVGAIVGDFFFKLGDPGLGILIDNYRSRLQSEQLYAAIIAASLLGVVVFWLFGLLGDRVVGRWHDAERG